MGTMEGAHSPIFVPVANERRMSNAQGVHPPHFPCRRCARVIGMRAVPKCVTSATRRGPISPDRASLAGRSL